MNLILSQVAFYPPLEEQYEPRKKEIFIPSFPTIEDVTYDSFPCDEESDQIEGVFIDWYLELITKDQRENFEYWRFNS